MVGTEHTITLTPGYSGFGFNEWFLVWMDLDQDGDIDGAGERLYSSTSGSNDPIAVQLSIPADAVLGSTRMRISMHSSSSPLSACAEDFQYGETEDYCVTLLNNSTRITEITEAISVVIHPQPADQSLSFLLPGTHRNASLSLDVFDGSGRTVVRSARLGPLASLATADLANGVYTYRMTTTDGAVARGRFLVTHLR